MVPCWALNLIEKKMNGLDWKKSYETCL